MSNDQLTQLGAKSEIPATPSDAVLETFDNPYPKRTYLVRFSTSEFTSLCPITGQPDYAMIFVDYVPKLKMIESKSFKLFMASFRNHGAFHESCTNLIAERLNAAMLPTWIRVSAYWNVRGGVGIDCFAELGKLPPGIWVPPHQRD